MKLALSIFLLLGSSPSLGLAQITLTTDRDHYVVGDMVEFQFHNGTPHDVIIPHEPPYCVWSVELEHQVFCGNLPSIVTIGAGESFEHRWDTGWQPHAPGTYRILMDYMWPSESSPGEWQTDLAVAEYSLGSGVPAARESWSVMKARY